MHVDLEAEILPEICIQCSEDGIEFAINRIFHKYGIKIESYHEGHINDVYVRRLMADPDYIMHEILFCSKVAVEAMSLVKMSNRYAEHTQKIYIRLMVPSHACIKLTQRIIG